MITISLQRGSRYNYKGELYQRGKGRSVSNNLAKELLALTDDKDVPWFLRVDTKESEEPAGDGSKEPVTEV